jgi:hypothetical protein
MNNIYDDESIVFINGERTTIKNCFIDRCPQLNELFSAYNNTNLFCIDLTSVGILLGIINYKRRTGVDLGFDQWF